MKIIEVNRNTLSNLYEQYPESFKGLSLEGNNLVYNGESVDISKFNINDLLGGDNQFGLSLSILSAEDIFKIVRLHAVMLSSSLEDVVEEKKEESLEDRVELLKQENPLMKSVSIISKSNQNGQTEYINIVDSNGADHLFENDRNVNIFAIYEILKFQNPGRNITPDELCNAINRKLHSIQLEEAESLVNKSTISEDFANKMNVVNEPYKDDKMHQVFGNDSHDIAVVADLSSPEGHRVVTFDKNEFGDLVVENHDQNVSGTDTTLVGDETHEDLGYDAEVSAQATEAEAFENSKKETVARLISEEEFYGLLNSSEDLTEEQRKNVDLYYAYLGDLMIYEDYLLPELKSMLNNFRGYVYNLEYGENEGRELNQKQEEAVQKSKELAEKKSLVNEKEVLEKAEDNVKRLELIRDTSNTGSISTIQVIAFIVGVAIILTAITLYLLG